MGAIAFGGLAVGMLTLLIPVWIYESNCGRAGNKVQGKHAECLRGRRERRGKRGTTKYSSLEVPAGLDSAVEAYACRQTSET